MSKTIGEVKECFATLEINVEIKFNGKTLSINGEKLSEYLKLVTLTLE